jgi:hypothetical protein
MTNIAEVVSVATRRGRIRALLTGVTMICVATAIAGCGGGIEAVVVADPPPPPPLIIVLSIRLSRVGPEAVEVDWSDDPDVHQFTVQRNGDTLANVMATSLIDTSVFTNVQYCYQVSGYSVTGDLIAATDTACIVLGP